MPCREGRHNAYQRHIAVFRQAGVTVRIAERPPRPCQPILLCIADPRRRAERADQRPGSLSMEQNATVLGQLATGVSSAPGHTCVLVLPIVLLWLSCITVVLCICCADETSAASGLLQYRKCRAAAPSAMLSDSAVARREQQPVFRLDSKTSHRWQSLRTIVNSACWALVPSVRHVGATAGRALLASSGEQQHFSGVLLVRAAALSTGHPAEWLDHVHPAGAATISSAERNCCVLALWYVPSPLSARWRHCNRYEGAHRR